MIEEQYVSIETAKLAKEKGFNEFCFHYYYRTTFINNYGISLNNSKLSYLDDNWSQHYAAPTQSLLARWLREKHNMCVEVNFTSYGFVWCVRNTNNAEDNYGSGESGPNKNGTWDNYEEAMETCLQEALKFI